MLGVTISMIRCQARVNVLKILRVREIGAKYNYNKGTMAIAMGFNADTITFSATIETINKTIEACWQLICPLLISQQEYEYM